MLGLKYIGRKALPYTDALFKTGFVWESKDSIVWMDEPLAGKFLAHPDVWQRTDKAPAASVKAEKPLYESKVEDEEEQPERAPLVQLEAMDKPSLINFAQRNFGQKLSTRMTEDNMRDRIRNWMNSPITGG